MSRFLGQPIHKCFVYPDFDKAIEKFAALGLGPFYVLAESGGDSIYRGEVHAMRIKVGFVYDGDNLIEIIAPVGHDQQSTYGEFIRRNPEGGLHHIAYWSQDFDETLAMLKERGTPFSIVQDLRDPRTDKTVEVYCEPDGIENPVHIQLTRPGLFDRWFNAMKKATDDWDGQDLIRDAYPMLQESLAAVAD